MHENLSCEQFRRLTGIKRKTFEKMIEILSKEECKKKKKGGRKNNLSMQKRLLMTLEYLREYRTYFHIAGSFGVSESTCFRNVRWVEDTLIKSKEFALPGKKALQESGNKIEVALIDSTETRIQRPKKNKKTTTLERKNITL